VIGLGDRFGQRSYPNQPTECVKARP
jgi:hypothetical protein